MDFGQFQFLLGQTVMYCQIIESDVKFIYALLKSGSFKDNYEEIKDLTLGNAVHMLEEMDNYRYMSKEYYGFLKKLTGKRNHWCHKTFINFMYVDDVLNSKEYLDECARLREDNTELAKVHQVVETNRLMLYNIRRKKRSAK